jgi:hypothetical protein
MMLAEALPVFKSLELKMSEAYLWCSINFEDYELRKFFSEMTDAELGHARALESLGSRPETARAVIDISPDMVDDIRADLEARVRELSGERDVQRVFQLIADLEKSELNAVFDSIVRGLAELNLAHLELTTKQHIASVREAADRFGIASEARAALDELMVKDRGYYRLFTD